MDECLSFRCLLDDTCSEVSQRLGFVIFQSATVLRGHLPNKKWWNKKYKAWEYVLSYFWKGITQIYTVKTDIMLRKESLNVWKFHKVETRMA